jgi:hypothetical protein
MMVAGFQVLPQFIYPRDQKPAHDSAPHPYSYCYDEHACRLPRIWLSSNNFMELDDSGADHTSAARFLNHWRFNHLLHTPFRDLIHD